MRRWAIFGLLLSSLLIATWGLAQDAPISSSTATPIPYTENRILPESVFVRSGPAEDFTAIGALYQGELVRPVNLSPTGDWVLIAYRRGFAWIERSLVDWQDPRLLNSLPVLEANLTPTSDKPPTATLFVPSATPSGNYILVTAQSAYVRGGPGRLYLRLGQLRPGETVEPISRDESGNWILIRYLNESIGFDGYAWIARNLVQWENPSNLDQLPIIRLDNLTPSPTFTLTHTPTASATASATQTPTLTVTASNTPTVTASYTPSQTPSVTPSATSTITPSPSSTATATHTPSATSSVTSTSTATPTPSPSTTPSATSTITPSPSSTATATHTPSATSSATSTSTATPTPSPSTTPSITSSATELASATSSITPSSTYTPTPSPSTTPSQAPNTALALAISPTPEPRQTDTLEPIPTTATLSTTSTPTVTLSPSPEAGSVLLLPATATPEPNTETPPEASPDRFPTEFALSALIIASILLYSALYWRASSLAGRFHRGFISPSCPVCQTGQLSVENRPERFLGIPDARHTVRCTQCPSVLRETRYGRWRYAIDRNVNPALYERYNNREITERTLETILARPSQPQFIDDSST